MIAATFVVLALAAALFCVRLVAGPTLADRVVAANGIVLVGMGGIATQADVAKMRGAGVQTFLVGESFMREAEPGVALQRLFAA